MAKREERYLRIEQAEKEFGLPNGTIIRFIREEWIQPAHQQEPVELDEEDVARACLIRELKEEFGVNDEAIPLILHLLDQLNRLRLEFGRRAA